MRISGSLMLAGSVALAIGTCGAAELPRSEVCADVQVGTEHVADLDCINRTLRTFSVRQQGIPAVTPISPGAPSTAVGIANQRRARQMMGTAFGTSAKPQRPRPAYVSPPAGCRRRLPQNRRALSGTAKGRAAAYSPQAAQAPLAWRVAAIQCNTSMKSARRIRRTQPVPRSPRGHKLSPGSTPAREGRRGLAKAGRIWFSRSPALHTFVAPVCGANPRRQLCGAISTSRCHISVTNCRYQSGAVVGRKRSARIGIVR